MTITKKKEGNALILLPAGRLDTGTTPELESIIDAEIPGVNELVFDFEGLEYISSAGLRVILKVQKIMNKQGSMKIVHVNENVMEIFEMTGFSDILTIE